MIRSLLVPLTLLTLAGCAEKPPKIAYDDPKPAVLQPEPPKPVEIVKVPEPLPLPGQLKAIEPAAHLRKDPVDPVKRVELANAAAKMDPTRDGYVNAIQVYPYTDGALYQLYVAPLHVTDVALQPGEQLQSVAAGDTLQWKIGDTASGEGTAREAHVLIKPTRADLPMNNIVIATDRRTYHLEAHPTLSTYMAAVSWRYPEDEFIALRKQNADAQTQATTTAAEGVDLAALRFRYKIAGDDPPWKPIQVFDDQHKVYIQFPPGIGQGETPPLFIVGPTGESELVNYRVRGNTYIVDRLFASAELRLGADPQQIVKITRTDGTPS
jgi:P-type conjugative transfer protein TrbG